MVVIIKNLFKFFLFVISLVLLFFIALAITVSSPRLLNATLPYILDTDEIRYEQRWRENDNVFDKNSQQTSQVSVGTPVYVRALRPDEFRQRYQLESHDLSALTPYFEAQGYPVQTHWDARNDLLAAEPNHSEATKSEPLLGYQLLVISGFPNACLDLFINQPPWFDYLLVLELAACDE